MINTSNFFCKVKIRIAQFWFYIAGTGMMAYRSYWLT